MEQGWSLKSRSVGAPNDGAELRAVMAVTVFVPGGDAPGDVDDEVALTLPSQQPMIFQDSEVEMRDRVGVLEAAVDIVSCTHLYVSCRVLSGDPPARKKSGAVRFHSGARVVRAKSPPERICLRRSAAESCPDCRSVVTTSLSSRWPGKSRGRRRAPG